MQTPERTGVCPNLHITPKLAMCLSIYHSPHKTQSSINEDTTDPSGLLVGVLCTQHQVEKIRAVPRRGSWAAGLAHSLTKGHPPTLHTAVCDSEPSLSTLASMAHRSGSLANCQTTYAKPMSLRGVFHYLHLTNEEAGAPRAL